MKPRLDIIGAGKVGMTLARLWRDADVFEIGHVFNRSPESTRKAISFIGAGTPEPKKHGDPTAFLMIATADDGIEPCAHRAAESGRIVPGSVVFHCSGSISSVALAPLREKGAHVASLHPVKSFADAALAVKNFTGTFCGLEGDEAAVGALEKAVDAIGGKSFRIDPSLKAIYHAGSVFAANYLVTVVGTGLQCLAKAGLSKEQALEVLKPLVMGAVENVFRFGPGAALTGPIARGDAGVVARQLDALEAWDETIAAAYRKLALLTVELSIEQGRASAEALDEIAKRVRRPGLTRQEAQT